MALHDVHKGDHSTGETSTNANDLIPSESTMADGTVGITNKSNSSAGPSVSTKNARILVYDGLVNRVLIGLAPDGTYGIWVSKSGIDVLSAF